MNESRTAMNPPATSIRPTFLALILWALAPLCTQAQDTEEPTAQQNAGSQETDVNEDNYRRFMELRDDQVQRPNQPYAALAPPSNLEKLGRLPESSQKHLRNQLREVILERGRWTPEEAGTPYPYVPSEAADKDPALRQMESEAWSELVQNYHAREAEIYQAGERGRNATAQSSDTPEAGTEKTSSGQDGQASDLTRQQAGDAGAAADAGRARQAGVTQNALQYLTGQTAAATGNPSPGAAANTRQASAGSSSNAASATEQAAAQASERASDQASAQTSEQATAQAAASSDAQTAAADSVASNAEAASESASAQATASAQSSSQSQETSAESKAQQEVIYRSPGVIAIKDLGNLQGVSEGEEAPPEEEDDGN